MPHNRGFGDASDTLIHIIDDQERVATADLLEHVLQIPPAQQSLSHAIRLANVMRTLGWSRDGENKITINGKQARGYFRPVRQVTSSTD